MCENGQNCASCENARFFLLKGASHETEMGQIWYQKKDLEKLELRRYLL